MALPTTQAARLPVGIAPPPKCFGSKAHKGRQIEASGCVDADEMRSRVLRKRYPYTIAVIGPQGSGKTTLIKTLAQAMGAGVPDEVVPSSTGTGLDTTVVYTRHMSLALIDTPGDPARRRDVINALAQADGALLVVSSIPEEWKNSTANEEWQEYVKLARGMDMDNNLFTVINKIDDAGDNQNTALSRFMRARMPLQRYFEKSLRGNRDKDGKGAGVCKNHRNSPSKFGKRRIFAASGLTGIGVHEYWRNGPSNVQTLMDKLGGTLVRFFNGFGETGFALNKEVRQLFLDKTKGKPLRVLIDDVFYGKDGYVAVGKVASGTIRVGDEVAISPGNVLTTAKSIKFQNADSGAPNFNNKKAVAGERVEITIGEKGLSANMIFQGSVMGSVTGSADAPETVTEFEAIVHILKDAARFSINVKAKAVGSLFRGEETTEQPFDFALGAHPAYFDQLLAIINPNTGRTIRERPESVEPGQTARCVVRLSGAGIPLDVYKDYKDTGRFLVRGDNGQGRLVAVGRITSKDWL